MIKRKYIDINKFQRYLQDFLNIPTWTKSKHNKHKVFSEFLKEHMVSIISVKQNSKYNHCSKTHSFTIFKVPEDKLGKLFKYRGKWVLIYCNSYGGFGWGSYWNEIYRLKKSFSENELKEIKMKFGSFFVLK